MHDHGCLRRGEGKLPDRAPFNPADHWRYRGGRARQSWIAEDPHPQLEALVNARATYWASSSPIPGGPAYENFELTEPFRDGRELRFRIEPLPENDPE